MRGGGYKCQVFKMHIKLRDQQVRHMYCCCSAAQLCSTLVTPWTAAHQASLSFTIPQSLLKLMSIESVMPSNHLILCHRLILLFSISPSNEYSGSISFRIDWLDLLAVQGTLKSLF